MSTLDLNALSAFVDAAWTESITDTLVEYVAIPNKSPAFDADWQAHGYMDQATDLIANWMKARLPEGASMEVIRMEDRTPLILAEIPGTGQGEVLLYGHLDKQPEMEGWAEGLGPWEPVIKDGKLYGRGGADDGYAAFAALTAINALKAQGAAHPRCVILIEASEESGSPDLPPYIDQLKDRIGTPDLVIALDSGCGNYDQLWSTTSLRGMVGGTLRIELLTEGVHSGGGSGLAADTMRVARILLDRLEDSFTGETKLSTLKADIPEARVEQARLAAEVLGDAVWAGAPLVEGARSVTSDPVESLLNNTWRSTLTVTGQRGLPDVAQAGNVLRPYTELQLSFRLPPTCDHPKALAEIKEVLTSERPYGANVTFHGESAPGWEAPAVPEWLHEACDEASRAFYDDKPVVYMGEGGSIPFMGMLGEKFPEAAFLITGVLGPQSNAHGPNEFLHLSYAQRLNACVAMVLARMA